MSVPPSSEVTTRGDDAMKPRHWLMLGAMLVAINTIWADDPTSAKDKILARFVEEMVALTPGTGAFPASFTMGSTGASYPSEMPQFKVTLKSDFAIAKYEVTQELYEVIAGKNPSRWKGNRNAVEMVSWDEANEFCRKASEEL